MICEKSCVLSFGKVAFFQAVTIGILEESKKIQRFNRIWPMKEWDQIKWTTRWLNDKKMSGEGYIV